MNIYRTTTQSPKGKTSISQGENIDLPRGKHQPPKGKTLISQGRRVNKSWGKGDKKGVKLVSLTPVMGYLPVVGFPVGCSGLLAAACVAAHELIYTSSGVNELALTSVEGV